MACWINTLDFDAGRERSLKQIENSGWFVRGIKEEKLVTEEGYEPTDEGLEVFKEALVDGEVCVIIAYPHRRKAV